jgi:DNA-directed RNA polymerase specialized sigma24 family protein
MRRRSQLEVVPLAEDLDQPVADPDPLERWPGLLAAAVARRVLTPRQVVLIAQTRMDGRPLCDVARDLGRPYGAVKKERQRAEAALREFALDSVGGSQP